jgi:hypothetical protein
MAFSPARDGRSGTIGRQNSREISARRCRSPALCLIQISRISLADAEVWPQFPVYLAFINLINRIGIGFEP